MQRARRQAYTQRGMNRPLVLPLAAAVAALAAAGPAAGLSSEGISSALYAKRIASSSASKSAAKTHTCQAGDTKEKARARSAIVGGARKTAVVACEQPPRSGLIGPGLKQAVASALATLG
jgi:hypothetical protein